MKKTRYIIIDDSMGVFLGTYKGSEFGAHDGRVYVCFAANNPFGLTNAYSFKTENSAKYFINDTFSQHKKKDLKTVPVETNSEFPTVIDIIKSGYVSSTHDMIDMMFPTENMTIH